MNKASVVCLSLLVILSVSPFVFGNAPFPGWQSLTIPTVNLRGASVISCGRLISWYAQGACIMTDDQSPCEDRMRYAPLTIVTDDGDGGDGDACDGTTTVNGYCTNIQPARQGSNAQEHNSGCSANRACRNNFFFAGNTEASFTINSIKSKLPRYALRAGLEVEIDIAYGFVSARPYVNDMIDRNGPKVKVELVEGTDFGSGDAVEEEAIATAVCGSSDDCDAGMELVDFIPVPSSTSVTSLVNCQTLRISFTGASEFNLEDDKVYSIRVTVFNSIDPTSGIWFYNPTLDIGSEIGISAVRIIETVGTQPETRCIKYTGPVKALTETTSGTDKSIRQFLENDNQDSRFGGPLDGCHVCPDLYNGQVYCTQEGRPVDEVFIDLQFDYNYDSAGQKITGGYFILFGAEIGNGITATVKMDLDNDGIYETPLFENARPIEATPSFQGRYFLCGNCFYNTYVITNNIDRIPSGVVDAALFFPTTGLMCVAGYQFIFTTADVQGPQFGSAGVCDTAEHEVIVTPRDPTGGVSTGDLDDYYVPFTATDNCDLYQDFNDENTSNDVDITLVSKRHSTVTIWDYRQNSNDYLEQLITVSDYSGNKATCTSKLKITPSVPFVLYPQPSSTVPVNDIIVQWSNYAPVIDATARVTIIITPNVGCTSTAPKTLVNDFPYAKFIFYYRDSITGIDTSISCSYSLSFTVTAPNPPREVTFVVDNLHFAPQP